VPVSIFGSGDDEQGNIGGEDVSRALLLYTDPGRRDSTL
jgi:hypothetical protein